MASLKRIHAKDEDEENVTQEIVSDPVHFEDEPEEFYLQCGYEDEQGTVHTSYTLREMTGKDEEAISRADLRDKPAKIINVLLSRCVRSIGTFTPKSVGASKWDNIIQNITVGDQDAIFMELLKMSHGKELTVKNICPYCKTKLNTTIDLDEDLKVVPFSGDRLISFSLPKGFYDRKGGKHTEGKLRHPRGIDREILTPVAKTNIAKADTIMLTRICKFDDGAHIDEGIISDLSVKDRTYLQNLLKDNLFGIDAKIEITCDACGNSFDGSLNPTNFI